MTAAEQLAAAATGAGLLGAAWRAVAVVVANARASTVHRLRVERWLADVDERLGALEDFLGIKPRPRARSEPPKDATE